MKITLHNYQKDIVAACREAIKTHRMIVVVLATGGGKGVIMGHIAHLLREHLARTLLLSHRYEIHRQIVGHCLKAGESPGQIISGQRMTANDLQVGMVQTVHRKLKYMKDIWFDAILPDEFHHYTSRTFNEVINYQPDVKIIGFTATPYRTDRKGLWESGATLMIEGPQTADLIPKFLTPPVVFSSETTKEYRKQHFKKKRQGNYEEYDRTEQTAFTSKKYIVDDTVNSYNRYFNGAPCIIFCCSVADCELVSSAMRGASWKCEAVHDKLDKESRRKYIDGLGNGTMNAVCSYDVLGEGVDIPILAGVIIRRLTASLIVWLQQCGRALRKAPGKNKAFIIDQAGNIFDHGHPLEIRKWSLQGDIKTKDDTPATLKQCPNCGNWVAKSATICNACGEDLSRVRPLEKEIKIIDAPLVEIKAPELPTGRFALDAAEVITYNDADIDTEIIEIIAKAARENDPEARERLEYIAKMFNHSHKWTQEVWDKYIIPGRKIS